MRIEALRGLRFMEAYFKIENECPRVPFKNLVSDPKDMANKAVVFRGNFDNLATNELCVRMFRYISEENRWAVSDVITYNGDGTSFEAHFDEESIKWNFWKFYQSSGFIVDA